MSQFELPKIPPQLLQSLPQEVQEYIGTLAATIEVLQAQNQALIAQIETLQAQNQALQAQNKELLARLNANSQNSDKPPSSDSPFTKGSLKTKKPSGLPPGGQVGHAGHQRELVPLDRVDHIIEVRPYHCSNPNCQLPLKASDQVGQPHRHQVWELPPLKAVVTEYQCFTYECSQCQTRTRAPLPAEAPPDGRQFGPHLVAVVGLLHGHYQLSLRQIQDLALSWWGLPLSLGAIAQACCEVSNSLEMPYEHLAAHLQKSEAVHVDETGWKKAGQLCWLWVVVAAAGTLFKITARRNRATLTRVLGAEYNGFLHSDRHSLYLGWLARLHQLCWAHLLRNLRGLAAKAGPGPPQEWVEKSLTLAYQLFHTYHLYRAALAEADQDQAKIEAAWQALGEEMGSIRAEFKAQLERGQRVADGNIRAFSRRLLRVEERLYLFVKEPCVSPTNNAAERALRPAVIWRKKCYGNQSEEGCRFVERVLTVRATCQAQGQSFLSYLTASVQALWSRQATPNLFPSPATP